MEAFYALMFILLAGCDAQIALSKCKEGLSKNYKTYRNSTDSNYRSAMESTCVQGAIKGRAARQIFDVYASTDCNPIVDGLIKAHSNLESSWSELEKICEDAFYTAQG